MSIGSIQHQQETLADHGPVGHPCVECGRPDAAHPDEAAETALCEGCLMASIQFRMSQDGF